MDRNRYFYELLTEKRSAANKAKNQAEKRAAKEARRVRAGKPTGSKRGKDSYDGRTLNISGKSGEPGTGKGGVEQRKVTGKGYDDEAYSESVNYEDIYLELIGESIYNTYYSMGAVLAEALGLSLNEGLQRDIRVQRAIRKRQQGNIIPQTSRAQSDEAEGSQNVKIGSGGGDKRTQYGYKTNPEKFSDETRSEFAHKDAGKLAGIAKRAERRAERIKQRGETPQGIASVERGLSRGNKGGKSPQQNIIPSVPKTKDFATLSSDASRSAQKMRQSAQTARDTARDIRLDNLRRSTTGTANQGRGEAIASKAERRRELEVKNRNR